MWDYTTTEQWLKRETRRQPYICCMYCNSGYFQVYKYSYDFFIQEILIQDSVYKKNFNGIFLRKIIYECTWTSTTANFSWDGLKTTRQQYSNHKRNGWIRIRAQQPVGRQMERTCTKGLLPQRLAGPQPSIWWREQGCDGKHSRHDKHLHHWISAN